MGLVEEALAGEPLSRWTPALASALGNDLRRWHGMDAGTLGDLQPFYRRWTPRRYRGLIRSRLAHRVEATEEKRLVATVDALLRRPELLGPRALAHGDLRHANLLVASDENLAWFDMDAACLRPKRHDLATALFYLLLNDPPVIDACEEAYFDDAEAQADWHAVRRDWFILYYAIRAAAVPMRDGSRRSGDSEEGEQAARDVRRYIHLAEAALEAPGQSASTGEYVSEMISRADARTAHS